MDMVRYQRLLTRAAVALVALVLLFFVGEQYRKALSCRSVLSVLWFNEHIYCHDHGGHHPADIVSIAGAFPDALSGQERTNMNTNSVARLLACPGVGRISKATTVAAIESDYIYINWEPFYGTSTAPAQYPMIYDRSLSNHRGFGVNVLTVGGRCFWDFRAHWLRGFAAKHPEYRIPLPD